MALVFIPVDAAWSLLAPEARLCLADRRPCEELPEETPEETPEVADFGVPSLPSPDWLDAGRGEALLEGLLPGLLPRLLDASLDLLGGGAMEPLPLRLLSTAPLRTTALLTTLDNPLERPADDTEADFRPSKSAEAAVLVGAFEMVLLLWPFIDAAFSWPPSS